MSKDVVVYQYKPVKYFYRLFLVTGLVLYCGFLCMKPYSSNRKRDENRTRVRVVRAVLVRHLLAEARLCSPALEI